MAQRLGFRVSETQWRTFICIRGWFWWAMRDAVWLTAERIQTHNLRLKQGQRVTSGK